MYLRQHLLNILKTNTQMFGSNSIKIKSINDWNNNNSKTK